MKLSVSDYQVNKTTANDQIAESVARLANGSFIVTWRSNLQDGSGFGVYAQRYDAKGDKTGSEFRINEATSAAQNYSSVTGLSNGGFVVAYQTEANGPADLNILLRHFDANGNPTGVEQQINALTANNQAGASVTALTGGGYVVTWMSNHTGLNYDIKGQRFAENGVKVGDELLVNTFTANHQYYPKTLATSDGGFLVAWQSYGADGSQWSISAQKYNSNGVAVNNEFRINTTSQGDQTFPEIASLSDGTVVVLWTSDNVDGSGSAVMIRHYTADGIALSGEIRVNTISQSNQMGQAIVPMADGGYTILWQSDGGQDGSGSGVFAQRFSADGQRVGSEMLINSTVVGDQIEPVGIAVGDGLYVAWSDSGKDGSGFGVFSKILQPAVHKSGADGNDVLVGSSTADYIRGLAGNDLLSGRSGNDTLFGGAGSDTLDGGTGNDFLIGGAGNDIFIVDSIGDTVHELNGIDSGTDEVRTTLTSFTLGSNVENLTFIGSGAFTGTGNELANILQGGAGNDTYIVNDIGDVIVENAGEGTDEVRAALASYTLAANVENLIYTGTAAFTGTGNTGNNLITGGTGNDSLTGDAGNDTLDGGIGADTLIGGIGNDTYIVDNTSDVVTELAGQGTDTVRTSLASYTLGANVENLVFTGSGPVTFTGNALNNSLTGGSGADLLTGLDGNDTLNGGAGADTLIGGTGNDTYVVDNIGDVLIELPDEGIDTVQSSISHTLLADFENLTLTGSAALTGTGNALNNLLTGNGAANLLIGLEGDDTLNGGGGADTLVGGIGNDLYVVDNAGDMVTELVGEGIDTVSASINWTLGANIENLTLTGSAAISATGNELNNVLTGNSGANVLDGGLGADSMAGGAGNDVYIVDDAGDVVTELAGQGIDEVRTSLSSYLLNANVEVLSYTGTGDFAGAGNALDNLLTGGDGADTLDGGAGNNLLIGGGGNDVYLVGLGDQVVELAGEGIDEVRTALTGYTLTEGVETLTYTGVAAFAGTGNGLDNLIAGGAGADTLDGGSGADTLIGGLGDDVYVVDSIGDTVIEGIDAGIDEVRTTLSTFTLGDNVERLVFQGGGDAVGTGNGLDNWLAGNAGNDTLDGGDGNDTLLGGLGNDVLTGGSGADLFAFVSGDGQDTITDFDAAQGDRIGLAAGQSYSVDTNANGDAVIVYGTSDILTLVGIQPATVSSAWFVTI